MSERMLTMLVYFVAYQASRLPPGSSFVNHLPRKQFYERLETFTELLPDGCHFMIVYENDNIIIVKIVRFNIIIKVLKDSTIDVTYN